MKTRTIRKCRKKITAPGYWKQRLEYVTCEARWYEGEYAIRHHLSDKYLASHFRRKIPWYKMKSAAHQGEPGN